MVPEEQSQLGRYRLLRLIARGGMGEIYLAEDASISRQVAMKVIRSEITPFAREGSSPENARLFEREARAIAMLDHPHILPLYDYGEQKQEHAVLTYLVMPYRPEGSLATWLEQRSSSNPLALEEIESIIAQAASALQYTHEHQIIHQDVKPSNFLIRTNRERPERPDIQISDFGIARLNTMTSGASQNIRGTPGYMSPEQWAGQPGQASDQYALAVMVYELVTGNPPFKGNPMQMMYAHMNTLPQTPCSLVPGLPSALDAVLLRGLAKRPEDRFPGISAFAQAFQQAIYGAPSVQLSARVDSSASQPPGETEQYTPLTISEAEALHGSERLLALPRGIHLPIIIPAGAYDGQILEVNSGEMSEAGPNLMRLKLAVRAASPQAGAPVHSQSLPDSRGLTSVSAAPTQISSASPPLSTDRPPQGSRTRSRGMLVALMIIALLLILGGNVLIYAFNDSSGNAPDNTARAAARTSATQTALAGAAQHDRGTASARASAILQSAAFAQASASAGANATALANPYGGTLALSDPLADNSLGYNWDITNAAGDDSSCSFTNGAYHMIMPASYSGACASEASSFNNFAFQAQIQFFETGPHSGAGGLIFRANATGQYYLLEIYDNGEYAFQSCDSGYCSHGGAGSSASARMPSFHPGPNQSNTIAVVARNGSFTFYANGRQFAGPLNDSTYSAGAVGFYAEGGSDGTITDVAYSNARVWQL